MVHSMVNWSTVHCSYLHKGNIEQGGNTITYYEASLTKAGRQKVNKLYGRRRTLKAVKNRRCFKSLI